MIFFVAKKINLSFYGDIPLAVVVVIQLGRFVWVEKYRTFGDPELNAVVFLFFGLDFAGAIWINLESIIFWNDFIRESCFS